MAPYGIYMVENTNQHGEPDYSQLYVYAGTEQPSLSNMTVYESDLVAFSPMGFNMNGSVPLSAHIIGSSHYISTGGFPHQYREMTSCRQIEMVGESAPNIDHYDITQGIDDVLIRTLNGHRVEITIQTRPFNPPYNEDNWDVVYVFGPGESGAPTAIRFNGDVGWETIHTYPEFDIELYTRTDWFAMD